MREEGKGEREERNKEKGRRRRRRKKCGERRKGVVWCEPNWWRKGLHSRAGLGNNLVRSGLSTRALLP